MFSRTKVSILWKSGKKTAKPVTDDVWLPSLYLILQRVLLLNKTSDLSQPYFCNLCLFYSWCLHTVCAETSPLVAIVAFVLQIEKHFDFDYLSLWSRAERVGLIPLQLSAFQEVYFILCSKGFKIYNFYGKTCRNGWNMIFVFWSRTDISFTIVNRIIHLRVYHYFCLCMT